MLPKPKHLNKLWRWIRCFHGKMLFFVDLLSGWSFSAFLKGIIFQKELNFFYRKSCYGPDMKTMQIVARWRVLLVSYFFQYVAKLFSYKIIHLSIANSFELLILWFGLFFVNVLQIFRKEQRLIHEKNKWPIFQKPYKNHHFYAR